MTMPEPPIMLDLDPSGYVQGLGTATRQTEQFGGTLRTAALAMGPLQSAMNQITPSRAAMAGIVGFTAVAAKQQQQLSQLAGSAKVTGANFERMSGGIRQMARELPIGTRGATEMVTTLSRLGVASSTGTKELNSVSKAVGAVDKSFVGGLKGVKAFTKEIDDSFGTRGKMATDASRRITDLGKTFTRAGAAVGESSTAIASGMVQLNRSMGTGLNAGRVEKLTDSLTTLSLTSGASATGILQFSKAIAPMAQASGIGQTKVMGIATAFAKLGDDGFAGANAFSKMMNDLNRSVREGTPQMAAYAQMAGKTTKEFRALYEANPAEALTQVVEAIGSSGNAPRLLEQIGLEGTRTARVLTNLAQSGDLRGEIEKSVGSFGNGSTLAASDQVFGGLSDSMQRLGTNAEQTAEALGRPFLSALTGLTDAMGAALTPLREAIDNSGVQKALTGLSYAALPLLLGFKVLGPLLTSLGVFQMASSGPMRGLLGGFAASGAPGAGLAGRLGGNAYNARVAAGLPVGVGRMLGVNEGMAVRGAAAGRFLTNTMPGTGPGLLNTARTLGASGAGMYMRMLGETARQARTPFYDREATRLRPMGAAYDTYSTRRAGLRDDLRTGMIDRGQYNQQLGKAFQQLSKDAGSTGGALRTLSRGLASVAGQAAVSGAAMGGRAVAGGLGRAAGMFGGPVGLAMTGGVAAYMIKSKAGQNQEQMLDAQKNATSWIDDYRMAIGKATEATSTFAGRMTEAAKAAGNAPQTLEQARGFDQAEMDRAIGAGGKPVRDYKGMGVKNATASIRLQAGTSGIAADELNRVQQDLALSGYSVSQIQEIMGGLGSDLGARSNMSMTGDVTAVTRGLAGAKQDNGFASYKAWDLLPKGSEASSPVQINNLSKTTMRGAEDLAKSIADRRTERSGQYGEGFATSEMLKEMDAAIAETVASGNTDLQRNLTTRFQGLLGIEDTFQISRNDLEKSGGFSNVLARENRGFREGIYDSGMDFAGSKAGEAASQGQVSQTRNWTAQQIREQSAGNPLADWFEANPSAGAGPDAAAGIRASIDKLVGPGGTPESPSLQVSTMQEVMSHARNMGMSMGELATKGAQAANAIGNVADASHQLLMAIHQEAVAVQEVEISALAPGAQAAARGQRFAGQAALDPNDDSTKGLQAEGVTGLRNLEQQARQVVTERLTRQREYQVQSQRMAADHARQGVWQTADYTRQIGRVEQDYGIQRLRAQRDRDRQLVRAQRDFGKQMRRMAEDQARAMYDPYQRIQVQATWDVQNLMGNLREQNAQIANQVKNLGRVRGMGGSEDLIKLLGLNDPKNAQQLAQLVDDMVNDPRVVGSLNRAAAARQQLGGKLANDQSNTQASRAREDFSVQMKDSAAEFETAMNDMADNHKRSLDRAAEDRRTAIARTAAQYATAVERMRADVKRADEVIVGDLEALTVAMNQGVAGQFVDFQKLTKNGMGEWNTVLKGLAGDWKSIILGMGTELKVEVTQGNAPSANPTSADAAERNAGTGSGPAGLGVVGSGRVSSEYGQRNGRLHAGIDLAAPSGTPVYSYLPGTVTAARSMSGYGNAIYVDHGGGRLTRYGHLSAFDVAEGDRVGAGELIGRVGNTGRSTGPHLHFEMHQNGRAINPRERPFAGGGIALAQPGGMAARVGEAGSSEAMIPLNEQGIGALAEAMRRFITSDDMRGLHASGGTTYITYDSSSTHYDNRVIIEHVDLQAESPRELAEAAAAKSRLNNLTAAPQRRR